MSWLLSTTLLLCMAAVANAALVPCLQVCTCETTDTEKTIRCDATNMTHFPLPVTDPKRAYNFLALTCNDIRTLPALELITMAFPDLHGLDLQGNKNLNCSSIEQLKGKLAVLSDCAAAQPMKCTTVVEKVTRNELWDQVENIGKKFEVQKWVNLFSEGLEKMKKKKN